MKKAQTLVKNSKPAKKLPIKKERFQLPESFLTQLSEFTNGGYVLIIADEMGEPQVYSDFDNALVGMGLIKYGQNYFKKGDKIISAKLDLYDELGDELDSDDEDSLV